ncbi:MAG TPA: tetratricopeptide repeat protein [Chloroflexia bacterium]|nr:tetratricopeptide repeat protein [Chloroflexia bacterium]
MLETIHEFAAEKLEEVDEGDGLPARELRRRHALYFLALAEEAEPHLQREEQAQWFNRLEWEHNNLHAAMEWAMTHGEEEVALRFGAALMTFWYNRYPAEGRWWLEGALRSRAGQPTLIRGRALHSAALALRKTREYAQARLLMEESLRIYQSLGDPTGIASSLHRLADLISESGAYEERPQAEELYQDALKRFGEAGDLPSMAKVLNSMGERARTDRDYARAIDFYEKSLALGHQVGDKQGIATTQTNLAYALYRCEEYGRAMAILREALGLFREVASAYSFGWALIACAGVMLAEGQPAKGARLIGLANRLSAPGGAPFDPVDQTDREEIEGAIKAALSDDEWQRSLSEGSAMSMDKAIEEVFG